MANEAFIFTRDRFPDTEALKAELKSIFDALHLHSDFGSNDVVSVSSSDFGCGCVMYVGDDADAEYCADDAALYHLPDCDFSNPIFIENTGIGNAEEIVLQIVCRFFRNHPESYFWTEVCSSENFIFTKEMIDRIWHSSDHTIGAIKGRRFDNTEKTEGAGFIRIPFLLFVQAVIV